MHASIKWYRDKKYIIACGIRLAAVQILLAAPVARPRSVYIQGS